MSIRMILRNFWKLAAAIAVCEAAGIIGALVTAPAVASWYPTLVHPSYAPPPFVFGPVWTALYALMGVAAFLVWRKGFAHAGVKTALGLFAVQLALNVLWSVLFFGLRSPAAALAEIVVLWAAIAYTMHAFARVSRAAAWLLAPYLAWVSFAALLTYGFWSLN